MRGTSMVQAICKGVSTCTIHELHQLGSHNVMNGRVMQRQSLLRVVILYAIANVPV